MDKLDLLCGDNYKILEQLEIKHPTLRDIKELGYDKYNEYLGLLCLTAHEVGDMLWFEQGIWYEDISDWWLFYNRYVGNTTIQEALKWFTGKDFGLLDDGKEAYLYCQENNIIIQEPVFMATMDFIREINFMNSKSQYNPGNKRLKLYLLEQQRKKRKRQQKSKIDLISIISSVAWKSGVGVNYILDMPIYQIYDAYFRLCNIDNYDKTMTALYSGNIDTSKTKIDLENINWSNIIAIQ